MEATDMLALEARPEEIEPAIAEEVGCVTAIGDADRVAVLWPDGIVTVTPRRGPGLVELRGKGSGLIGGCVPLAGALIPETWADYFVEMLADWHYEREIAAPRALAA